MSHRKLVTKLKNNKLKNSSANWLRRQLNDPYVLAAQKDGYRSRAAYKLLEIDQKFKILNRNSVVLDLGAAPGGWSQIAAKKSVKSITAVDLLPISSLSGVSILQGDFTSEEIVDKILSLHDKNDINLILSDMAPNISGTKAVDNSKMEALVDMVFDFTLKCLNNNGSLVMKIFQNGSEKLLISNIRKSFVKVSLFKPASSRKESPELYIIAQHFKKELSSDQPISN